MEDYMPYLFLFLSICRYVCTCWNTLLREVCKMDELLNLFIRLYCSTAFFVGLLQFCCIILWIAVWLHCKSYTAYQEKHFFGGMKFCSYTLKYLLSPHSHSLTHMHMHTHIHTHTWAHIMHAYCHKPQVTFENISIQSGMKYKTKEWHISRMKTVTISFITNVPAINQRTIQHEMQVNTAGPFWQNWYSSNQSKKILNNPNVNEDSWDLTKLCWSRCSVQPIWWSLLS